MLVKLQRPPPEMRIFFPIRSACSSTATRRPRLPASMAQSSPAAPPPRTRPSNWRIKKKSHVSGNPPFVEFPRSSLSRLNYVREKTEKFGSNYQRTRIVEEIRRRAALPEYFIHRFRSGSHRRDRPEWVGQVDDVGDAIRSRQTGQRGRGDPEKHSAELRCANFGLCPRRDGSFGHRKRAGTRRDSRNGARCAASGDAGPRGLHGS